MTMLVAGISASERSETGRVSPVETLLVLLAGLRSTSKAVTLAVLAKGLERLGPGVAVMETVAVACGAKEPRFPETVLPLRVTLVLEDTYVRPAGSASVNRTLLAVS